MDFKKNKYHDFTKVPYFHTGLMGGLAAVFAEMVTFPLDNIKTRIQMNGRDGLPTYNSTFDCISKTFKSSGLTGFYRGVSAAVFRQITYSSVRIGAYERIKRYFSGDINQVGFFRKLFAGGLAGAIGCVFGNPGDILKIRLINDLNKKKYKGIFNVAQEIIANDSYQGFFKGLNVNILRAICINAAELATYDQSKGFLVRKVNLDPNNMSTHFLASFIAGFAGAFCSSPADVVKTRFMNQLKSASIYKGPLDCAWNIFQNEGITAFYKGFVPYFLRTGPWTIAFFMMYEKIRLVYANIIFE